jgi:hypothetical protein
MSIELGAAAWRYDGGRDVENSVAPSLVLEYRANDMIGVALSWSGKELETNSQVDIKFKEFDASLRMYFSRIKKAEPFLSFGVAQATFDFVGDKQEEPRFKLGVGFHFPIKHKWGITSGLYLAEAIEDEHRRDRVFKLAVRRTFGATDNTIVNSVSLINQDSDGDGVLDHKDQCPNTRKSKMQTKLRKPLGTIPRSFFLVKEKMNLNKSLMNYLTTPI